MFATAMTAVAVRRASRASRVKTSVSRVDAFHAHRPARPASSSSSSSSSIPRSPEILHHHPCILSFARSLARRPRRRRRHRARSSHRLPRTVRLPHVLPALAVAEKHVRLSTHRESSRRRVRARASGQDASGGGTRRRASLETGIRARESTVDDAMSDRARRWTAACALAVGVAVGARAAVVATRRLARVGGDGGAVETREEEGAGGGNARVGIGGRDASSSSSEVGGGDEEGGGEARGGVRVAHGDVEEVRDVFARKVERGVVRDV